MNNSFADTVDIYNHTIRRNTYWITVYVKHDERQNKHITDDYNEITLSDYAEIIGMSTETRYVDVIDRQEIQ